MYSLRVSEPGTYELAVGVGGFYSDQISIEVGDHDVIATDTLLLRPRGTLLTRPNPCDPWRGPVALNDLLADPAYVSIRLLTLNQTVQRVIVRHEPSPAGWYGAWWGLVGASPASFPPGTYLMTASTGADTLSEVVSALTLVEITDNPRRPGGD